MGHFEPAVAPLRLFIAVAPPPAVQTLAQSVIERMRGSCDVRWVTPSRLHLLLKFLGKSSAEKVPELKEKLEQTANTFSRFAVECSGAGAFPSFGGHWPSGWVSIQENPSQS